MNRRSRLRSKTIMRSSPPIPDPSRIMDRLHAYAYFLEGLLPVLDRPECAAAFRDGVDRARVFCAKSRPFSRAPMCTRNCCERACWAKLTACCRSMKPRPRTRRNRPRVFRFRGRSRRADSYSGASKAQALPFVNPVSTAFCVQALALWDDHGTRINPVPTHASTQLGSKCDVI